MDLALTVITLLSNSVSLQAFTHHKVATSCVLPAVFWVDLDQPVPRGLLPSLLPEKNL